MKPTDSALLPRDPATGEPLDPRPQPGYYAGFSTLSQRPFWDEATRDLVDTRVEHPPKRQFFTEDQWSFWNAVFAHLIPQTDRTEDRQIPLIPPLDERLYKNRTDGYRYASMPPDREAYILGIEAIDAESRHHFAGDFLNLPTLQRDQVLQCLEKGETHSELWKKMDVKRFWQLIMSDAISAYYAHPWAWDEVGFGGPAYPRAYTRLERGEPEPWEVEEQRYDWMAPTQYVSDENRPADPENDTQSHHGSGGTH